MSGTAVCISAKAMRILERLRDSERQSLHKVWELYERTT